MSEFFDHLLYTGRDGTCRQIFEANVGYKREFTLTSVDGETFEEELTWGVDSEIGVKAGYVADASLVVDERKQVASGAHFECVSGV